MGLGRSYITPGSTGKKMTLHSALAPDLHVAVSGYDSEAELQFYSQKGHKRSSGNLFYFISKAREVHFVLYSHDYLIIQK